MSYMEVLTVLQVLQENEAPEMLLLGDLAPPSGLGSVLLIEFLSPACVTKGLWVLLILGNSLCEGLEKHSLTGFSFFE